MRGPKGEYVAKVNYGLEEFNANVDLIAAAPDLHEALTDMVARFYRDGGTLLTADAVVKAEAALAKADGRA